MEKLNPKEYEICEFDGVNSSAVYLGSFDNLKKAKLIWRKENLDFMEINVLTLDEIRNQLKQRNPYVMITIFVNSPLHGEIIQYGNYGDEWYRIGETCGYA